MVVKKRSEPGLLLGTRSSECLGFYCKYNNIIIGLIAVDQPFETGFIRHTDYMRGLVNLASLSLSLSLSLNVNIYSLAEETASDPRNISHSPVQKFDYIPRHSKIRLNEHTLLQLFLNCTDLL